MSGNLYFKVKFIYLFIYLNKNTKQPPATKLNKNSRKFYDIQYRRQQ